MTMTYTLRLRCPDCGAVVVWENERPDWQEDADLVAEQKKAERWLRRFEKARAKQEIFDFAEAKAAAGPMPAFVEIPWAGGPKLVTSETHFVHCPACDGRIYRDDHAPTETPADTAESPERKAS